MSNEGIKWMLFLSQQKPNIALAIQLNAQSLELWDTQKFGVQPRHYLHLWLRAAHILSSVYVRNGDPLHLCKYLLKQI